VRDDDSVTLAAAVTMAVTAEEERFRKQFNLCNLQAICSGRPGGLGKPKQKKMAAAAVGLDEEPRSDSDLNDGSV